MIRVVGRWVAIVVLAATGVLGLLNAVGEWPDGTTIGQRAVTAGEILYGVLGMAGAAGVFLRRHWGAHVTALWAADVTLTGTGAVVAWGGEPPLSAATASAFVGCVLVGTLVWWLARLGVEQPTTAREHR